MRWENAAQILQEAMAAGTCRDTELGKAHLLLGAMAYQQGDVEAARRHFGQAHRCDPQIQPAPLLFPPQVIEFYRATHDP
jgi:Flp pilus assembly protein TadD